MNENRQSGVSRIKHQGSSHSGVTRGFWAGHHHFRHFLQPLVDLQEMLFLFLFFKFNGRFKLRCAAPCGRAGSATAHLSAYGIEIKIRSPVPLLSSSQWSELSGWRKKYVKMSSYPAHGIDFAIASSTALLHRTFVHFGRWLTRKKQTRWVEIFEVAHPK